MPISRNEEWVQIAELDSQDQIRFTKEFVAVMGELGWEAKAFVGHLLRLWYDPFEHMLDYSSGDAKVTQDQSGEYAHNGFDEPQEVVEYWAMDWSKNGHEHQPPHLAGMGMDLSADWYRDVLRAKLVSIKLPKRLLVEYRDKTLKQIAGIESYWREKSNSATS